MIAVKHQKLDCVELLLTYGATVDIKYSDGVTPLIMACHGGKVEMVRLLLDKGANLENICFTRVTPLYIATLASNITVVEFLLQRGANVNIARENGITPLHVGCIAEVIRPALVRLLLEYGANINTHVCFLYNCFQHSHTGTWNI